MSIYLNKQNVVYVLAIGGICYIVKSTYDYFSSSLKEKKENRQIKSLIEKEKSNITSDVIKNKNSKHMKEIYFYIYYKVLYTVYQGEFSDFIKKRRKFFSSSDVGNYFNYSLEFIKNIRPVEQNIFQHISEELDVDPNVFEKCEEINLP
jgi:hypothetical protein